MLLTSSFLQESKEKMWPSCTFSEEICFLRLWIWCLNHSFSWVRFCRSSQRKRSSLSRLCLEARKAFLQNSFSALSRSISVSQFSLSVLRFESFLLLRLSLLFFRRNCFRASFSSEAVLCFLFWMKRFCLGRTFSMMIQSLQSLLFWPLLCLLLLLLLFLSLRLRTSPRGRVFALPASRPTTYSLSFEKDREADLRGGLLVQCRRFMARAAANCANYTKELKQNYLVRFATQRRQFPCLMLAVLGDQPNEVIQIHNQMRQRLDLDALLRKYETISSPGREQPFLSPRMPAKTKAARLNTQSTYYHQNDLKYFHSVANFALPRDRQHQNKTSSNNFQMSKSECQGLLLGMKEELGEEQRGMESFVGDCIGQLMLKFQKEHQELRRELMSLVDHSLQLSKRSAMELIQGYRRHFPKEYSAVNKKIAAVNEEINSLLAGLSGNGYKKTIAEVVTRDFAETMKHVREEIQTANGHYREGLTSIQLDRSKLARIQQSLQKIYVWRAKEEVRPAQQREDGVVESRRSSKRKIFDKGPNKLAMTERHSQHSAPKQMRRTFFNFDSNS